MGTKLRKHKVEYNGFFWSFGMILFFVAMIGVIAQIELSRIWQYSHHLYNYVFMVNKSLRDIQTNVYLIESASLRLEKNKGLSKQDINHLIEDIDKFAKESDRSFQFLYQNYLGPRSDVDSAYNVYNSWRPKTDDIGSFANFGIHNIMYAGKLFSWLRIMTNFKLRNSRKLFSNGSTTENGCEKRAWNSDCANFCFIGGYYLFIGIGN